MQNIGILVFKQRTKHTMRARKDFEWRGNVGVHMVKDVLERAGHEVGFCSPESAYQYDTVLVSLISIYDVYDFIYSVAKLGAWKHRTNAVIVGGWGIRNVAPIRNYADYAVFGRAEHIITELVESILQRKDFQIASVMDLKAFPHPVTFGQAEQCYPYELDTKPVKYQEYSLGCRFRCLYCIYSHARQFLKTRNDNFYETSLKHTGYSELIFKEISTGWNGKKTIRTSLDGWSERLRYAFNKRISNEDIVEVLQWVKANTEAKLAWLNIYIIVGFPTETEDEIEAFEDLVLGLDLPGKLMYINFLLSPFRPAPLTPSAWCASDIETNWRTKKRSWMVKNDNLKICYRDFSTESPVSLLLSLIIERATPESDDIIHTICFSKQYNKLSTHGKLRALSDTFDLSPYTREYRVGEEELPTWYLSSFTPNENIERRAAELAIELRGGLQDGVLIPNP